MTSTLHLCWGAQAGLYYHYGLQKKMLPEKMFGLFWHRVKNRKIPLVRGFDDAFLAPHSRHTEVSAEHIHNLAIGAHSSLAVSQEAGVFLCMAMDWTAFFVMGHPEYHRVTCGRNSNGIKGKVWIFSFPKNYYPDNDRREQTIVIVESPCQ